MSFNRNNFLSDHHLHLVVSRHEAAIALLKLTLEKIDLVQPELKSEDIEKLQLGDCVYGNLPVPIVAKLSQKGIRYFHIDLQLPLNVRGSELNLEQLKQYGFKLIEVSAQLC